MDSRYGQNRVLAPANSRQVPPAGPEVVTYFGLNSAHPAIRCLAQLQQRYKALETQLNNSKVDNQRLQTELDGSKQSSQKQEKEITELKAKCQKQETTVTELTAKAQRIERDLAQSNAQNTELLNMMNQQLDSIEACQRSCKNPQMHWPGAQQNITPEQSQAPQQQANEGQGDLLAQMLFNSEHAPQGDLLDLPDDFFGVPQSGPVANNQAQGSLTNNAGNQQLAQSMPLLFEPFNPNPGAMAYGGANANLNFGMDQGASQNFGMELDFNQPQPGLMDFGNGMNTQLQSDDFGSLYQDFNAAAEAQAAADDSRGQWSNM
ncbi:hypothetical protein GGS26DRAFT_598962 [Hypomontagnella submonticulosa]|nr:hypothetical protein GGS26DRAFT_598962 [Hypomontagnella submonticulosa]